MQVVTHEDYLAAVATEVCEQYPATAATLSEVELVFGMGPRRRGLRVGHRVWLGGEAVEPLPLVEIAAIVGHGELVLECAAPGEERKAGAPEAEAHAKGA